MDNKVVGALAPHVLDEVIGDNRDAESIIKAISESSLLQSAVHSGIAAAIECEDQARKHPGWCGPSYAQAVRQAVQEAFCDLNC